MYCVENIYECETEGKGLREGENLIPGTEWYDIRAIHACDPDYD